MSEYRLPAPVLMSAEGFSKVHAYREGWQQTLCGWRLGPAMRPVGMDWFTPEELAQVHPDRPCKSCVRLVRNTT